MPSMETACQTSPWVCCILKKFSPIRPQAEQLRSRNMIRALLLKSSVRTSRLPASARSSSCLAKVSWRGRRRPSSSSGCPVVTCVTISENCSDRSRAIFCSNRYRSTFSGLGSLVARSSALGIAWRRNSTLPGAGGTGAAACSAGSGTISGKGGGSGVARTSAGGGASGSGSGSAATGGSSYQYQPSAEPSK